MRKSFCERRFCFFGLCLFAVLATGYSAWYMSPTLDEPAHLAAGVHVWRTGRTDLYRVNPPLVRSWATLPLNVISHQEDWRHDIPGSSLRTEWKVGADFMAANGPRSFWLLTIARWMCLPVTLLGLWTCWRWGRELAGEQAGLLAAGLWACSPNLIGHGALITCDVAATALGLLFAWRWATWRRTLAWRHAFQAGLCLGIALLAKLYWVLQLGLFPLVTLLDLWCRPTGDRRRRAVQALCLGLIGINVLNLGYGFQGTGTRLGDYRFYSRLLSGEWRSPEYDLPGNRFQHLWLGKLPVPLPADYVTGLDLQQQDLDQPHWSYLFGEHRQQGWPWYYAVGLAVKVPLATWCLAGAGLIMLFWQGRFWQGADELLPLWLPTLALFVLVSAELNMNRHVRYVFPVLPVLYLLAGQSAALRFRWLPVLGLGAVCATTLWHLPYGVSYFNLLAGDVRNGRPVLIDSSLDWGQDLRGVQNWLARHPDRRPVTLACVHAYPLESVGLDLPVTPTAGLPGGWHLISRHLLHNPRGLYQDFRRQVPVDHIGFSFNIYYVSSGADAAGGQALSAVP
jgi:hypothetical protein